MRAARTAAVALLCGYALVACDTAEPPPFDRLVIATGGAGGVYYALGQALAEAARERGSVNVQVLETAASVANLRLLVDGGADVGFATVDSAALAFAGQAPFTAASSIAAITGLYDDYLQIVVPAAGPVRSVAGLRGRRVSTGSAGSGTEIVAARILEAAGLTGRDIVQSRLSATASAAALRAGEIDAFFFTGGLPTPAVAALAAELPIRLLSVQSEAAALQERHGEFYVPRSIPADMYGLGTEVSTVGIPNVLLVRADMAERTAYLLAELIFSSKPRLVAAHEQARRLDRRSALATYPIPLHPGAARFYRDSKLLAACAVGTVRSGPTRMASRRCSSGPT